MHIITTGLSDWGSLHPVVVHIPIALLFIVPIFILIGMFHHPSCRHFYLSALILLLIGTLSMFTATSTGEHASESIGQPDRAVLATLEAHDRLAHQTRTAFSVLSVVFLLYVWLLPRLHKKYGKQTHRIVLILFLLIYAYILILLFNTAHQGGKLVHQHGIKSSLYSQ